MATLLALKWRPVRFSEVMGQESAVTLLRKSIQLQRFFPCYLIAGPFGAGKTTLARIFSKAILCDQHVAGEPCDTCESCIQFDRLSNPNYEELDSASHGSVDDIRRLRDSSLYKPIGGKKRKVVYLYEAGSISNAGNNAFLKLLEEGAETVVFVMTTTEPDRILDTVKSRAFEIELRRITPHDTYTRIVQVAREEGIEYEDKALHLISSYSQGHLRDALMLLDQIRITGPITLDMTRSMLKVDSKIEYLKLLYALGTDFNQTLEILELLESRRVPSDIWKGLLESSVDCFLLQKNVEPELDPVEIGWVKKVLELGPTFLTSTMALFNQLQAPHHQVELRFNLCQIAEKVGKKGTATQATSAQNLRDLARKQPVSRAMD
jgi:DNA polymerase-3 subunit gamma/tau